MGWFADLQLVEYHAFVAMIGGLSVFSTFISDMKVNVKVTLSCPSLYDPVDYTVHGSLQARILEWVDFPFSRGSSQARDQTQASHIVGGFFTS